MLHRRQRRRWTSARSVQARAVALATRDGAPLIDLAVCEPAVTAAANRLIAEPELVAPHWTVICVLSHDPEFDVPLLELALRSQPGSAL
jgi:xanthine/CO dehydrogenase XdhC/CoxF family maturation factor